MGEVVQMQKAVDSDFPWSPTGEHKDTVFYCHRLGLDDLKLKPDITGQRGNGNIFYYVYSITNPKREYPVRPEEIVPADSKAAKIAQETAEGLFEINLANFLLIKDFLLEKFIPSFNWTNPELKDYWISQTKRPRDGVARQIEAERQAQSHFLSREDFVSRMKVRVDDFPWQEIANFIDFKLPKT